MQDFIHTQYIYLVLIYVIVCSKQPTFLVFCKQIHSRPRISFNSKRDILTHFRSFGIKQHRYLQI